MSDALPLPDDAVTIAMAHEVRPYLTVRWLTDLRVKRRIPSWIQAGKVIYSLSDIDALAEYSPSARELVSSR